MTFIQAAVSMEMVGRRALTRRQIGRCFRTMEQMAADGYEFEDSTLVYTLAAHPNTAVKWLPVLVRTPEKLGLTGETHSNAMRAVATRSDIPLGLYPDLLAHRDLYVYEPIIANNPATPECVLVLMAESHIAEPGAPESDVDGQFEKLQRIWSLYQLLINPKLPEGVTGQVADTLMRLVVSESFAEGYAREVHLGIIKDLLRLATTPECRLPFTEESVSNLTLAAAIA